MTMVSTASCHPTRPGGCLNLGEMTRAAQASSEISLVLGGSGRQTAKTLDAEGFRENFFQVLIEEARVRRQDAERQIKHFVGWLDMAVNEDIVSTIGIVNKYFGGKLRDFTKKQTRGDAGGEPADPQAQRAAREADPRDDHRGDGRRRGTTRRCPWSASWRCQDAALTLEHDHPRPRIVLVDGAPTEFYSTALGRMVPLPDNNVDELLALVGRGSTRTDGHDRLTGWAGQHAATRR